VSRRRRAPRAAVRGNVTHAPRLMWCHSCRRWEPAFKCQDCGQWVPWCVGGDDEERCGQCWWKHHQGE
jgi:hypothetical protein